MIFSGYGAPDGSFYLPIGQIARVAFITAQGYRFPCAGYIRLFDVIADVAPGVGENVTFSFYKGLSGVPLLIMNITNNSIQLYNSFTTIPIQEGDVIFCQASASGGAATTVLNWTFAFFTEGRVTG
jgi:hypothetical protein